MPGRLPGKSPNLRRNSPPVRACARPGSGRYRCPASAGQRYLPPPGRAPPSPHRMPKPPPRLTSQGSILIVAKGISNCRWTVLPCGVFDCIQVLVAGATAAVPEICQQRLPGRRSIHPDGTTHDFGEGLACALGVAKLLVGIEFQGDGLCCHARKMHGMGESASATRSECG